MGKALGLKSLRTPTVLDATAGLGTDSYLMAHAGCLVTAISAARPFLRCWKMVCGGRFRPGASGKRFGGRAPYRNPAGGLSADGLP